MVCWLLTISAPSSAIYLIVYFPPGRLRPYSAAIHIPSLFFFGETFGVSGLGGSRRDDLISNAMTSHSTL